MANGRNVFVGFDLVHPLDNYERVARALAALGSAVKISSMLWYIDATVGAREIEAALKGVCNPGDSMIVIDATTNYAILHNLPVPGGKIRHLWNQPARPVAPAPAAPAGPRANQ